MLRVIRMLDSFQNIPHEKEIKNESLLSDFFFSVAFNVVVAWTRDGRAGGPTPSDSSRPGPSHTPYPNPHHHQEGGGHCHLSTYTSKISTYNQEGDELFQRSSAGSFSRSESRLSMSTPERWGQNPRMLCISNTNLNKVQRVLCTPERWLMAFVFFQIQNLSMIFESEGLGLQTANKKVLLFRVHIGFIDTPTFVLGRVLMFSFNSYLH